MDTLTPIERAIRLSGGVCGLAKRLGVTYQAVQRWRAGKVPAERCPQIEAAVDGAVTRQDLRPDVFG